MPEHVPLAAFNGRNEETKKHAFRLKAEHWNIVFSDIYLYDFNAGDIHSKP